MDHNNYFDWHSVAILDLKGGFQIQLHLQVGFSSLRSYFKGGFEWDLRANLRIRGRIQGRIRGGIRGGIRGWIQIMKVGPGV